MELSKVQNRFINHKSSGYQLLKGKEGTGKSTASIYKAINLENNYCIYEEDKILFVTSNYTKTYEAMELYKKESNENYFYSLFSLEKDRLNIITLEELIDTYSKAFRREKGLAMQVIDKVSGIEILKELENEISSFYKKSKFLQKATMNFILEEILWIKASNFSKDYYLEVDRKGRGGRIKKSSYTRESIYKIKDLYNENLINKGLMDEYDHVIYAISYINNHGGLYSHVILDDMEKFTKGEIDFIKAIYKNKPHSSFVFILNSELNNKENSWMVKGRKVNTLGIDVKGKSFNFKTKYDLKKKKQVDTVEKYKYINLKNKGIVEFNIDTASNRKEVFEGNDICYNENELEDIPMFNNIAAGTPIEMNDNIEGSFYIPKYWLERGKDTFILRVKGDSMVEKDICDGDLVVIKKQGTANHNEIVAASLDGEATLKTLNLNGDLPKLMPANSLYAPISLENKEVNILGVAIGIIKQEIN
ncbi:MULTISPECIES: transcriptional repressor LexA [Clostridium]|jgi:SOS regulatory protein LexA|uniref:transcriptional repressor LexA n=2 Tax=Clostridiaceae TaxID=31979 RepID=UPI00115B4441|nr:MULTISPECIES: transcriptional repressor LexA [Clostridium]MBS5306270.1 transcriptional repressor LexA [Clostridium sp.]MDB1933414.1 transcriptional repressor LexA [Clostridium tertium]MDB1937438.1 transcriptional repressor LexA [Clostridium tertium]MDB1943809.1 transcriptional repressor LexA [Clostridium tertium]MDB1951025.1 transcriptional repressor LexA [Clostridium tertium]